MSEFLEALKVGATIVVPLLGGGGGVWAYMTNRDKTRTPKSSSPSQITESQADLVSAVNDQTKTILAENARLRRESNRERRQLKQRADRQEKQILALTASVNEATAKHENCETNLADVRALIEVMRQASAADTLVINPHPLKDHLDVPD